MAASDKKERTMKVHISNPKHLPLAVFRLFFGEWEEVTYKGNKLIPTVVGGLKCLSVGAYSYRQQAPDASCWGKKVQEGHKVMWVVHSYTGQAVGIVVNGVVHRARVVLEQIKPLPSRAKTRKPRPKVIQTLHL